MEIEIELEEMDLEDLAMGKRPMKKERKVEKVSPGTTKRINEINKLIGMLEQESIADYKKLSSADRKALKYSLSELTDACYNAKSMIRSAMPEEEKNMKNMIGRDYD